jgi:hypothetical protein
MTTIPAVPVETRGVGELSDKANGMMTIAMYHGAVE